MLENRHELLPADAHDLAPIVVGHVDILEREALVTGGESDALDVRRERDPVDADHMSGRS